MSQADTRPTRIVILGGGFGGVYTGMSLEQQLRRDPNVEIVLVNKENYFTFQPMLAEVVSGNIGILDTVSPLHRLLPRTTLCVREIQSIDLAARTVTLAPGFWPRSLVLEYDHLVLALGTVTDFRGIPGIHEHALPFKTLADAIHLRNHLIHVVEEATLERDPEARRQLLTFVVAGGGFSGVEVAAEMNDFLRRVVKRYRPLTRDDIRVILVHSGERILERELKPSLSLYAQKKLQQRGVELRLKSRLQTATPGAAVLAGGERILTKTLVSTVPSSPNPLIEQLPLPKEKGRVLVGPHFEVEGHPGVWALGDCSAMRTADGQGFCPPTAQFATREAEAVARNIAARLHGRPPVPFAFRELGKLGSLGYRSAVAELFNRFHISGFLAWLMWRTIYWWKLPGIDRKIKVGISWFLDLLIPPETVQLRTATEQAVSQLHYEPGETVFRQGDLGDSLYIVLSGEAEVLLESNGEQRPIARIRAGEYFGEMALLNQKTRSATVRCATAMNVLALRQRDFHALVDSLPDLRRSFENVMEQRVGERSQRSPS